MGLDEGGGGDGLDVNREVKFCELSKKIFFFFFFFFFGGGGGGSELKFL